MSYSVNCTNSVVTFRVGIRFRCLRRAAGVSLHSQAAAVGSEVDYHYRQTKIEETVYELLTQQYELAKIEEAKEIPVVKVLDASDVPEKKSFPPRALIIGLGVAFSLCLGCLLVVGSQVWKSIDPDSPKKQLLTEIWQHVKGRIESLRSPHLNQTSSH